MMLIKLLMIPFKLVLKLALYSVGGVIFGVMFVLSAAVGIVSGFIKMICHLAVIISVIGLLILICSGIDTAFIILISLTIVLLVLISYMPEIMLKLFLLITNISVICFKAASFKLYKRKEYIILDNNYEFIDGELRRKDNDYDNRIMVRI